MVTPPALCLFEGIGTQAPGMGTRSRWRGLGTMDNDAVNGPLPWRTP